MHYKRNRTDGAAVMSLNHRLRIRFFLPQHEILNGYWVKIMRYNLTIQPARVLVVRVFAS